MKNPKPKKKREDPQEEKKPVLKIRQNDLERCPRCGLQIENIVWGKTDCPNCGLHFECC